MLILGLGTLVRVEADSVPPAPPMIYIYPVPMSESEMQRLREKLQQFQTYQRDKEDARRRTEYL